MVMKSKHSLLALVSLGIFGSAVPLRAAAIGLFDYAYNLDGVVTGKPGVPLGVTDAGFNYSTGLGSITIPVSSAGNHFIGLFLDHEIDEPTNTFFNEFGNSVGVPPAGLSWEIDEPGFVFGNIFTHFSTSNAAASNLDNLSAVIAGSPDDVSMALGWNFALAAGEATTITFRVSTTAPASGFYLKHSDPGSDAAVYFSSAKGIIPPGGDVPEPATAAWGLACLAALAARSRQRPATA